MRVKQNSKHLGIVIFIGFLLIIIGIVSYLVINYSNDQAEVQKRMEKVLEIYDTFKEDVQAFNDIRDEIYEEFLQEVYYQMLKDNDAYYKELFLNYEESLEVIDLDYESVEDKCVNVLHPKADINSKCEKIISTYEEVVNTYVSDVNNYNSLIDAYNEWLLENDSSDSELEKIKLDRDFLDINGDREYNGRADINTEIKDEEDDNDTVGDLDE